MGIISKYNKFFESVDNDNFQEIKKYNNEWKGKYPELKMLKLEPITDTNELSWLYSLNKKFDSINIDLFINITKSITSWNIDFELVMESEDEYLNTNSSDKTMLQDEKHYSKSNLKYEELDLELNKVCSYIRDWNNKFNKKWDFFPLVD